MTIKNPNSFSLYDLDLGEEIQFSDSTWALRVPGGWIFTSYGEIGSSTSTACFVPFSTEFQSKQQPESDSKPFVLTEEEVLAAIEDV